MAGTHKMLSIFIDRTDRWKDSSLYEAIVYTLERHGVKGATVVDGIMGYGIHRRVHRKGLFGVADEQPIVIVAVDEEKQLRSVLPLLLPMVKEGLITIQEVEVVALLDKESHPEAT
jgi:PII-like signaling protein